MNAPSIPAGDTRVGPNNVAATRALTGFDGDLGPAQFGPAKVIGQLFVFARKSSTRQRGRRSRHHWWLNKRTVLRS